MRSRRVLGLVIVAIVGFATLGLVVQANSAGAPLNAAVDGCTCHSRGPVSATLAVNPPLPNEYKPGEKIVFQVAVMGGPPSSPSEEVVWPLHRGGFALSVRPNVGKVEATGDQEIQDRGNGNWTHRDAKWRSWNLSWTPPSQGVGNVVVHIAANAVNGDNTNAGDSWAKGAFTIKGGLAPAKTNGTAPTTTPPEGGSPGPVASLVFLGIAAGVILARRRARD